MKQKLSERIQTLIDNKDYNQAIKLLANIDSPKATDWIRRIEALQAADRRQETRSMTKLFLLSMFFCSCSCVLYFWFASL